MRRALVAMTILSLCLPVVAEAQRFERDRGDQQRERGDQQNAPQPAQQAGPQAAGPQAVGPQGQRPQQQQQFFGVGRPRGPAATEQAAPPAPPPNTRAQAVPPANARAPEVAQDRDQRDERGREFDRDRREGDRDRRDFDRRDFRDDRDRRDFDRRDFRGDRDRGDARRFFNYRGRQYTAVRGPDFRYPRGWGYRHWNRGEFLPSLFLAAPFFFDYGYLGLPPPPLNYRWVRYGPDALLVNVYDGRIIDTIYDAFY